jgi:lipoprotein signal peptidase
LSTNLEPEGEHFKLHLVSSLGTAYGIFQDNSKAFTTLGAYLASTA